MISPGPPRLAIRLKRTSLHVLNIINILKYWTVSAIINIFYMKYQIASAIINISAARFLKIFGRRSHNHFFDFQSAIPESLSPYPEIRILADLQNR